MSEFSRETLLNIIETDHVQCGEASALARMALAAMDSSESVELPLDYLQGHKDGLEWASQLAEANHPETGDWLYDDPIELAKAIRKGPDMPPVQPVADSEPDRNPVLAYADSYRDMAKQGAESVPIWSVITDLERNIAPLYRHAQPELEIESEPVFTLEVARADYKGQKLGNHFGFIALDAARELKEGNYQLYTAQPAPVVPDGYVMVPKVATEKMLIAGLEEADPLGSLIDWNASRGDCNTREQVQGMFEAMLAAAPQSPGSEPATVPGKWIPVSERKPDCWCLTCRPVTLNDMRFVVCPDCGNKRCPRANDHRNACTRSNEPGQEGSAYPAAPQEVRGE
ncbi:DUF551 domain-containing protein [Klebsiella quasipneumoniae]|nr:DUF551 domain-containing protein [Klebsiella quasipneumoniae]MDZ1776475.1 DUF551 domain-containing protein [Klebsiella quasipneumoniae]